MDMNALINAAPIPDSDRLLILNNTVYDAPIIMSIVVITNTVNPIFPVLTQIYTYSESGGIKDKIFNLLLTGISEVSIPIPIPHGISCMYFDIVFLFAILTLADASLLSNAVRIRWICWLPSPILVNISIDAKITNPIVTGT